MKEYLQKMILTDEVKNVLTGSKKLVFPKTR